MKHIRMWTFMGWCFLVVLMGCLYARNRIYSPEADPGYETMWSFQLAMFAIFRLPGLVIILCGILFLETRLLKNRNRNNDLKPANKSDNAQSISHTNTEEDSSP